MDKKKARRSFLRFLPHPAKIALIRSPSSPNRWLRSIRLSLFKCPMIGSIADRRFNHFHSHRLKLFFLFPVIRISVPFTSSPCPRYVRSQYAISGCHPVILFTCSNDPASVCPSYGLPCAASIPITQLLPEMLTTATLHPNSYRLRAFPLAMHSTSGPWML